MRVILHIETAKIEFEEQGDSIHVYAQDLSTGYALDRRGTLAEFPFFEQYRQLALRLYQGIRPQLDAEVARRTPPPNPASPPPPSN